MVLLFSLASCKQNSGWSQRNKLCTAKHWRKNQKWPYSRSHLKNSGWSPPHKPSYRPTTGEHRFVLSVLKRSPTKNRSVHAMMKKNGIRLFTFYCLFVFEILSLIVAKGFIYSNSNIYKFYQIPISSNFFIKIFEVIASTFSFNVKLNIINL
jgi:hypothetical protein